MLAFQSHTLIHPSRTKMPTAKKSHSHDSFSTNQVAPSTIYFQPVIVHSMSAGPSPGNRFEPGGGKTFDFWQPPGHVLTESADDSSSTARTPSPDDHRVCISCDNEPYQPLCQKPDLLRSSSSQTSVSEICRICHCEGTHDTPLITPCYCSGTLKFIHQKCLQQWIKASETRACEVCRYSFIMESKVKPFRKWEKLSLSSVERRKVLCSLAFHIVAIGCVIWSLYVLIERTAEEIRAGKLEWPFWTKLVVVAIGFTGGLVFMYVQCKMYIQLFRRWKAYNKIIFVQNCPENHFLCKE